MLVKGIYYDGQTAADLAVQIRLTPDALRFDGTGLSEQIWLLTALEAIEPPQRGRVLRLTKSGSPSVRLVVQDESFKDALLRAAPHLSGSFRPAKILRPFAWIIGGVAAAVIGGYLVVQLAPEQLARVLPQSWRDRVGAQIEVALVENARVCTGKAGISALAAMVARIAEGGTDLPPLVIKVYDMPVMNAFAMPGDRIVITRELIRRAQSPEEVAGVLAHEIGHAANRHPEAQMVRITGIQILLNLITGGGSDTITGMAGLAALLRYSRGAEGEADAYANRVMIDARIDPQGLKTFFAKLSKEEKTRSSAGPFEAIGSLLSTHPGTGERIENIQPLPDNTTPRQVLSDAQWQDLKKICD